MVDVTDCALGSMSAVVKSAIALTGAYIPMFTCGLLRSKTVA